MFEKEDFVLDLQKENKESQKNTIPPFHNQDERALNLSQNKETEENSIPLFHNQDQKSLNLFQNKESQKNPIPPFHNQDEKSLNLSQNKGSSHSLPKHKQDEKVLNLLQNKGSLSKHEKQLNQKINHRNGRNSIQSDSGIFFLYCFIFLVLGFIFFQIVDDFRNSK